MRPLRQGAEACTHVSDPLIVRCEGARPRFPPPLRGRDRERGGDKTPSPNPILSPDTKGDADCFVCIVRSKALYLLDPLSVPPPQGGRERCGTALPKMESLHPPMHDDVCMPKLGSGDPGGKHRSIPKSGSGLSRGRTENVAPRLVTYPVVRAQCDWVNCRQAKANRTLFRLWARDRPHSTHHTPSKIEGMARRQGAWPGSPGPRLARFATGPGVSVTPRALRRANAASSAYASISDRDTPGALCPWRVFPENGRGSKKRNSPRRLPLPIPALKTPHENALDNRSG